jgi:Domain of unknown function (DUF4878)
LRHNNERMKKTMRLFAAVAFLAVIFTSCNRGGSPKAVAATWLTAFFHMDYENAKKVSTEETKTLLTQLSQFSSMVPDSTKQQYKKITVEVKDVKIAGDTAAVAIYTINDPTSKEASGKDQELHLVKQNSKWLVQFSKNDSMGGDDGADKPGAADSVQAQNPSTDAAPAGDNTQPDKK